VTDPTGRSFLSYRRPRANEAASLIAAQHELGIPTWQDVHDLRSEPTPDELRRVLRDPATANMVLLTTPEVEHSPVIRKIEVVEAHERWKHGDGFFIHPLAAGGLDYAEASAIPSAYLGLDNFDRWNWDKTHGDPISDEEAARVSRSVLRRRLAEIDGRLEPGLPWPLTIHTRNRPPFQSGTAIALDWCHHFTGRVCPEGIWSSRLIPAALAVADDLYAANPNRGIEASGLVSLPAAVVIGSAFMAPRGMRLSWRQQHPHRAFQSWALATPRHTATVSVERVELDVDSDQLAVVVSVNHDVEQAIRATIGLPAFRGIVRVRPTDNGTIDIVDGGEAVDIAVRLIEAIKASRSDWRDIKGTHLFIAAPAGLAIMLGQLLNGLGPVQTYEHIQDDGIGHYAPAALIDCSNR
jgi:hypothetical protein